MDRRETLKSLLIGSLAAGTSATLLTGCDPAETTASTGAETSSDAPIKMELGRTPFEKERDLALINGTFLSEAELGSLAILCDIILPTSEDGQHGSATEAEVPAFIDFIARDIPNLQTPIRGGLAWLNNESLKRFNASFSDVTEAQRMEIIEDIAYPDKARPEMAQGVAFFNRMRDLTMTGYFTSEMGLKALGYTGNYPNVWDGVPDEVLKDHDVEYDPEWLAKCVDNSKREDIAEWDENMNLIT